MNNTPIANRIHIGFFGCRNAGKSSLVNAITEQEMSVVSDLLGTTTDPVTKTMELLPIGPVVIIDTPGFDDTGEIGVLRIKKTKQILNKTDIAILVADGTQELNDTDRELLNLFAEKKIPYIIAYNKKDIFTKNKLKDNEICVSAKTGEGVFELKEKISKISVTTFEKPFVADLISKGDVVVLVVPIDESAPKGRLILPQQQAIRDILDAGGIPVTVRPSELLVALKSLSKEPSLVITDSQAFKDVDEMLPLDVPLTSFSILMARYKGFLETAIDGVCAIESLKDGDTVLMAEGCTHHRQCKDIGTVKIPNWIRKYTNKDIKIETSSGMSFPEDLSRFSLVIHCGGCMLTEKEVSYRMKCAEDQGVPITNYGTAIAFMNVILKRSIKPFSNLANKI